MKKMIMFSVCLGVLMNSKTFSQDFVVPEHYTLKTADDYAEYEDNIVDAANWLRSVPFSEQKEKRKEVSAFVVNWINGSPTVTVEITPILLEFEKKNPGMLVLFMAECARYVLENDYSTNIRAKHKAALHTMIEVYQRDSGMKRDKKMEKLIEADKANDLDTWLDENMNVGK